MREFGGLHTGVQGLFPFLTEMGFKKMRTTGATKPSDNTLIPRDTDA